MSGHDRNRGAGKHLLHPFEEGEPGHVRHDHVCKKDVRRLLFEQGQSRLPAVGLHADKPEGLAHGHAELADALLVIDDQEADSQVFAHSAFPMVFSTTEMNCCTRNGFSTQGAPVARRVATVSSLAISPVMKTSRLARSGLCLAIQACTWPPSTPPGVRISETMPRNEPFSSSRRASTPDSQHTTGYP